MARLETIGLELQTFTGGVEIDNVNGGPIMSGVHARSGLFSGQISSLVSGTQKWWGIKFSAAASGAIFGRFYIYIVTLPSAENCIMIFNNATATSTPNAEITLDSSGLLRLYNGTGPTQVGSASSALSLNTWYRIEMKYDGSQASGSDVLEARINGTTFATSSTQTLSAGITDILVGGNLLAEAQTQGEWYFDDIAVNDNTGTSQTSYPGEGRIVIVSPNAAGDSNQWTTAAGGVAGTSNNYTVVDEILPNEATDFINTLNASVNNIDLYNCRSPGGSLRIAPADTITLVTVGVRFRNQTTADATTAFSVLLEKTASGTKTESANIIPNATGFRSNTPTAPFISPIIAYTDPDGAAWTYSTLETMQIGVKWKVANTFNINVTAIWAMVEYVSSPLAIRTLASNRTLAVGRTLIS